MAAKKKPSKKTASGAKKKTSTTARTKASAPLSLTGRKKASKKAAKPKKVVKAKTIKPKKRRKPETLMCFLTTACVRYYNLRDDGHELNTLRHYRDNYLKTTTSGKKLVEQYYKISPTIVNHVERDGNKPEVYAFIHRCVLKACEQIEQLRYAAARTTYKTMVENLLTRYNLSVL